MVWSLRLHCSSIGGVARGQVTVVLNIFFNFKTTLVFELEEKFGFNTDFVRRSLQFLI